MAILPDPLLYRCRTILTSDNRYNSYDSLYDFFSPSQELALYKYFEYRPNPEKQISHLVSYLLDKDTNQQGQLVFSIFLRHLLLFSDIKKEEQHYEYVRECYEKVEIEHFLSIKGWDRYESAEVTQLVKHFLKCSSMQARKQREQVLKDFTEQFALAKGKTFNEEDTDFADVIHMFKACSDYRDIERLAYVVYQHEGETTAWKALDTLLRNLHNIDATLTRLQQLQSILETLSLTKEILWNAYDDSMPKGSEASGDKLLLEMLDHLAQARPENDLAIPPLMKFAQYLLHHAKPQQDTKVRLEDWLKCRADEVGIPYNRLETSATHLSSTTPVHAKYLLITVDARTKSTFDIQAWLMDDQNKLLENTKPYSSEEPVTLDGISKCIDKIRQDYRLRISRELIVEVFLPINFLSCSVDQWIITVGKEFMKLGIAHTVVARLIDRVLDLDTLQQWKEKWNIYQDFINGRTPHSINVTKVKGPFLISTKEKCNETYAFFDTLYSSHIVYLALDFAPESSQHATSIMNKILSAGIPIALWPRKLTSDQYNQYKDFLLSENFTLDPRKLPELPIMVKKQRHEAQGNADHHGCHLTLLWDDPDRLPPGMDAGLLSIPETCQ